MDWQTIDKSILEKLFYEENLSNAYFRRIKGKDIIIQIKKIFSKKILTFLDLRHIILLNRKK